MTRQQTLAALAGRARVAVRILDGNALGRFVGSFAFYAPQADIGINFTCLPDTVDPHEAEASLRRAHALLDFPIR